MIFSDIFQLKLPKSAPSECEYDLHTRTLFLCNENMIMSVWNRNEDEMFPFFLPDCQNDRILQEWPWKEVDKFLSCMLFS